MNIEVGEAFEHSGKLYVKTVVPDSNYIDSFDLDKGICTSIGAMTKVKPRKCVIVITG